MSSGNGIPHWSVFDGIKFIPSKPEALMAEINSAISSLEYAKATKLLKSPSSLSRSKNNNNNNNNKISRDHACPPPPPPYDARMADEAYKAGLASLAAGNHEEAFRSLKMALAKCPPNKTSAVAKIRSLISLTSQQLHKSSV